jgi:dipeptidyl aminopeptidase/acylaminoacyl peptidase
MNLSTRGAAILIIAMLGALAANAQVVEKRAVTFRDMISMHRLSDPQISPDNKWIAYVVATPNLETNRSSRDIWLVPISGGESRQLTHDGADERPRWSPDG